MPRKILIFGAGGQLGRELVNLAGAAAIGLDRAAVDISDECAVRQAVRDHGPGAIVNAAGYTAVDRAETEPGEAFSVNRDGAGILAAAAAFAGIPCIHFSTDYVFDGTKRTPYREDDPIVPLGIYGASKAAGEDAVRSVCPRHIIVRTSWVYSPYGSNFVRTMLRLGAERPELGIVDDQIGCPTAAADLASATVAMLTEIDRPSFASWGTYHYRGGDIVTWYGFAGLIFDLAAARGQSTPRVIPIDTANYPTPAKRPAYSVLATDKLETTFGIHSRPLRTSLDECLDVLVGPQVPAAGDRP